MSAARRRRSIASVLLVLLVALAALFGPAPVQAAGTGFEVSAASPDRAMPYSGYFAERKLGLRRFRFRTRREFVGRAEMFGIAVARSGALHPDACQVALLGKDFRGNGKELAWWKVHRSRKKCKNDNDSSCDSGLPFESPCFWTGGGDNDYYTLGTFYAEQSMTGQYCDPIEVYTAWYEFDVKKRSTIYDITEKIKDLHNTLNYLFPGNNLNYSVALPTAECGVTLSSSLEDIANCALDGHTPKLAGVFWSGHDGQPTINGTGCLWTTPDNYGDIDQTSRDKTAQVEYSVNDAIRGNATSTGEEYLCGCPDSLEGFPADSPFDVTWLGVGQRSGCEVVVSAHFANLDLRAPSAFYRTFEVGFDTDNNLYTGSTSFQNQGAEYMARIEISSSNGVVSVARSLWAASGSSWAPRPGVPYEVVLKGCAIDFVVNLHDLGDPTGTIASFCNTYAGGTHQEHFPLPIGWGRVTLELAPDEVCPWVDHVDSQQLEQGTLTAPVEIEFSEPIGPVTIADVSITPFLPLVVTQGPLGQYLTLTGVPAFTPGRYVVTLKQSIADCSGNHLTNDHLTCGQPVTFDLCVPEPGLQTETSAGVPSEEFASNQAIFVRGTGVAGMPATVTAYVVDADVMGSPGRTLIDQTSNGPDALSFAGGAMGPSSLGIVARTGEYGVVLDVDGDGELSDADRAIDPCDGTVLVNDPCDDPYEAGIYAYWPLDETYAHAGSVELENGHDGTWTGAPVPQVGRVHGALSFDGVNDEIDVPNSPDLEVGTEDFSVSGWISPATTTGLHSIIDMRSATRGYHVALSAGHLTLQLMDASGYDNYVSTAAVPANTWTQFVVTVERNDPAGAKLYLNGSLESSHNPTARAGDLTSGAPLLIGGHSATTTARFKGKLDEIALWDDILPPADVTQLFVAGRQGKLCPDTSATSSVADLPGVPAGPDDIHFSHANPFRPGQRIVFTNTVARNLRILVLDAFGRQIATLADGEFSAGVHTLAWDGRDRHGAMVPAGVYFIHAVGAGRSGGSVVLLR